MNEYQLQAIENTLTIIYFLGIIVCSALFSWWLLILLLFFRTGKYVEEKENSKQ